MNNSYSPLYTYGAYLLAHGLGIAFQADRLPAWMPTSTQAFSDPLLSRVRDLLGDQASLTELNDGVVPLTSIFSFVRFDDEEQTQATPYPMPQCQFSNRLDAVDVLDSPQLWDFFWSDVTRLQDGWGLLESFTMLLARDSWSVAGSTHADGISVYEQFKAAVALDATLEPDHDQVLLVQADLSGIQDMLFTLSSQGAAKALRGRSFYLQLLMDAIVRTILRDLHLPDSCVLVNAGGNVLLLARQNHVAQLESLRRDIDARLLMIHHGDLALALTWQSMDARDLMDSSLSEHLITLSKALGREKARSFASLTDHHANRVVGPIGSGSQRYCTVCHTELPGTPRTDAQPDRCNLCDSFGERRTNGTEPMRGLARLLADARPSSTHAVMTVIDHGTLPPFTEAGTALAWNEALATFGFSYRIGHEPPRDTPAWRYCLGDTQLFPDGALTADIAYGFRFLALATPRIEYDEDLQAMQQVMADREDHDEQTMMPGAIRSTTLFARWDSTGVDRYGVLRMDIDSLGGLLRERFVDPNIMRLSTLSAALNLFFEGWLDHACERATNAWNETIQGVVEDDHLPQCRKRPYVIYAGGDDLLIVGPWDVLPEVARVIRHDLGCYVVHGRVDPALPSAPSPITMSAGIFLESALFPLYQAAAQSGRALRLAKRRKGWRTERREAVWVTLKDGITFLDVTLGWEEFGDAMRLALRLSQLTTHGVPGSAAQRAPRALVHLLDEIGELYLDAGGETAKGRPVYGRWMPLLVYGLRRMADRVPSSAMPLREAILGLAGETLDLRKPTDAARWPSMRWLRLSSRWAELLIRKGEST